LPERETLRRSRKARRAGKAATTQAGEFVREEMRHIRGGKHGARSTKQAIAIGLSKARRAGVPLGAPKRAKSRTRRSAEYAARQGRRNPSRQPSGTRSRAIARALRRERRAAASRSSLARQARSSARQRGPANRAAAARRAVRTKGPAARSAAARRAARTRARSR
jgi:hypothetical protein